MIWDRSSDEWNYLENGFTESEYLVWTCLESCAHLKIILNLIQINLTIAYVSLFKNVREAFSFLFIIAGLPTLKDEPCFHMDMYSNFILIMSQESTQFNNSIIEKLMNNLLSCFLLIRCLWLFECFNMDSIVYSFSFPSRNAPNKNN